MKINFLFLIVLAICFNIGIIAMEPTNKKCGRVSVKEIKVSSYITPSKLPDADFVINPYVGCPHKCIYCYAEFMKRFTTGHDLEDWGNFVDVKLCDKPIVIKEGATVLFGSVTDPYNPYEAKYKITQNILQQIIDTMQTSSARFEILTKSSLVLRDLDLFKKLKNIQIGISMNTLDDNFRKQIEPYASSVEQRIEILRILKENGIDTYLFMSPIFPGITLFKPIVTATFPFVNCVYFENLNLRGAYKTRVLHFIKSNYPDFTKLFTEIYIQNKNEYWENLLKEIAVFCEEHKINYQTYFYHKVQKR